MTEFIVEGLKDIILDFRKLPNLLRKGMERAGDEAGKVIYESEGLKKYPPETAANRPPTPYYIRGQGMQYSTGNKGNSERYGTKWNVRARGYITEVGNTTSYGPYLGGTRQTRWAARYGWRKLHEVAREKISDLTRIYSAWAEWARQKAGL